MRLNSYFLPAVLALLLHAAVFAVLADVWFQAEPERKVVPRHVSAQIVDLKALAAHERRAQQAAASAAAEAKKREQEIIRKREAEAAKQREIARKKKEAQQQAKQEAERKAAEKRKQDLARKKAEEKKQADALAARKAAEAKAQAEAKARAEAKAQKDALAKQQAAQQAAEAARQAALDKAREAALAAALDEEAEVLAGEAGKQAAMGYMDYIRQTIERNWRISPSARNGMEVELAIHLLPSGEVDNAYITRSSGDERFDRDALRAVEKAGSFPELQKLEPVLFDRYYRRFSMRFRPENLRY